MAGAAAWSWSQHQYYVGEQDGVVTIFRGVQADVPGFDLSHAYETTNVQVDQLDRLHRRLGRRTASAPSSLDDAERTVQRLAANQAPTRRRGADMAQRASQSGALMQFVHRRRRGAELFLLVLALARRRRRLRRGRARREGRRCPPTSCPTAAGWPR